ncbi:Os01g0864000, partial [Oryza sativa Japonica Group]
QAQVAQRLLHVDDHGVHGHDRGRRHGHLHRLLVGPRVVHHQLAVRGAGGGAAGAGAAGDEAEAEAAASAAEAGRRHLLRSGRRCRRPRRRAAAAAGAGAVPARGEGERGCGGGVGGAVRGLPGVDGADGGGEGDLRVGRPQRPPPSVPLPQLAAPPPSHPPRLRRPLDSQRPLLPAVPLPVLAKFQRDATMHAILLNRVNH